MGEDHGADATGAAGALSNSVGVIQMIGGIHFSSTIERHFVVCLRGLLWVIDH